MRLLVFGASGGTGRAAVERAALQGMNVTAFVRRPERVAIAHARIRVVQGDALDADQVASATTDQDAVLSVLGTPPWRHTDVCSRGTAAMVAAMTRNGVRRLIVLSTLGAGDSLSKVGWFGRTVMAPLVLRRELEDKTRMEDIIRNSGLDWTIVRLAAGVLTNRPPRGVRVSLDTPPPSGRLSRADLAAFLVAQLGTDEFLHKTPFVA